MTEMNILFTFSLQFSEVPFSAPLQCAVSPPASRRRRRGRGRGRGRGRREEERKKRGGEEGEGSIQSVIPCVERRD